MPALRCRGRVWLAVLDICAVRLDVLTFLHQMATRNADVVETQVADINVVVTYLGACSDIPTAKG